MSTKRKSLSLARPVIKQSAKTPTKSRIDETRATVALGTSQKPSADTEPSAQSASPDSDIDDDELEEKPVASQLKPTQNGDVEMEGIENGDASDAAGEGDEAPTFGDLIRENSTVDVSAALAADSGGKKSGAQQRAVAPVNAISMGITLDQALRTDDNDLLESCLQINLETIENTIQRMDSSLAGTLLSKLAARMHRRPGRAYGLMKWVQWTLIAHGGTLVGQPEVVKRLDELSRVLEERTKGLNSLLALKGKLDMLDAQMRFRKSIKSSKNQDAEESDEDEAANVDEPGVVFVEGDANEIKVLTNGAGVGADDDEDDFPVMNGMDGDSDEDSEADEDFMDDDVEDEESMDEDEVDHDDVEESGEEESDEDSRPPAKVQKVSTRLRSRK